MTATIADDLTETDRDKSCVCKDQGIANIDARLMDAMAGCTMIGQSIINIKLSSKGRLSAVSAGVFYFR